MTTPSPWQTPRSAPLDGTNLYVWIDDNHPAGGYQWPGEVTALVSPQPLRSVGIIFRDLMTSDLLSAVAWRLSIPADRPSSELIARARAEFEEDDS